jgi:hypothetical protein
MGKRKRKFQYGGHWRPIREPFPFFDKSFNEHYHYYIGITFTFEFPWVHPQAGETEEAEEYDYWGGECRFYHHKHDPVPEDLELDEIIQGESGRRMSRHGHNCSISGIGDDGPFTGYLDYIDGMEEHWF